MDRGPLIWFAASYRLLAVAHTITSARINILLADDDAAFCQALRDWFDREPGLHVVGEARDGREAVSLALELEPDIILMDVAMPHLNGIEATRKIISARPDVRVIALSFHTEKRLRAEMLRAGASAYILKENVFLELLPAIRALADDQSQ